MAVFLPLDMSISDPQLRGGRPVLAGTSIRVPDIAANDNLDVAQVHAALAYYFQHKAEFRSTPKMKPMPRASTIC